MSASKKESSSFAGFEQPRSPLALAKKPAPQVKSYFSSMTQSLMSIDPAADKAKSTYKQFGEDDALRGIDEKSAASHWFLGLLKKKETEHYAAKLPFLPPGAFFVREMKSNPGCFGLVTIDRDNQVRNLLIEYLDDGYRLRAGPRPDQVIGAQTVYSLIKMLASKEQRILPFPLRTKIDVKNADASQAAHPRRSASGERRTTPQDYPATARRQSKEPKQKQSDFGIDPYGTTSPFSQKTARRPHEAPEGNYVEIADVDYGMFGGGAQVVPPTKTKTARRTKQSIASGSQYGSRGAPDQPNYIEVGDIEGIGQVRRGAFQKFLGAFLHQPRIGPEHQRHPQPLGRIGGEAIGFSRLDDHWGLRRLKKIPRSSRIRSARSSAARRSESCCATTVA